MVKVLAGMTALVTGASQSIGLASAMTLARDGAVVVVMGRSEGRLRGALDKISAAHPDARVEMFVGDACDETRIRQGLSYAYGLADRLDMIVPTVGGAVMQPLLMRDADSVKSEFDVNFMSVFLAIRHGVPMMRPGGSIVCISTTAVTQAIFGLSLYGASKAAMERLVRGAAFELGGAGIRINAVRPGMTVSPDEIDNPAYGAIAAATPLGRIGVPADLGAVVRFLAGPESGWVTGQTFSVDGGQEQGVYPDIMDAFFGKQVMDRIRAGQQLAEGVEMPPFVSTSLAPPKA